MDGTCLHGGEGQCVCVGGGGGGDEERLYLRWPATFIRPLFFPIVHTNCTAPAPPFQVPPYDSFDVIVDTKPPVMNVTLGGLTSAYTRNTTVVPCVTVLDINPVVTRFVLDNNAQVLTVNDNGCVIVAGLGEGNHTLAVVGQDAADNAAPRQLFWCVHPLGLHRSL